MTEIIILFSILFAVSAFIAVWCGLEWRRAARARTAAESALAAARAKLEQLEPLRSEKDALQQHREALQAELSAMRADHAAARSFGESQVQAAEALRAERDEAVRNRDRAAQELATVRAELAAERSGAEARAAAHREKEEALMAMKADVEKSFLGLAHQALAQNEQRFLHLANETFEKHKTAAAGGVKEVVGPVQEQFARLSETIAALDKARTEDKSVLSEQMRQVAETLQQAQSATGKLTNALRAAPKARGRWGEETLRNVLELSGLSAHIDFTEQSDHAGDGGKLKPDVVINLPGGRCIVVDSKVALSAYLDAMDAPDDAARNAFLKKHAAELRAHVKSLSSKDYAKYVPATADFVVMFVPGENFLAAAFEQEPELLREAYSDRVIIVGPSSLLALAKSIAYGWRQEEVAHNAEQIAKLGNELYARLAVMADKLGSHGNSLEKAVRSYNELVATTESRVLPSARRFRELGAGETTTEIDVTDPLDVTPRLPLALPEDPGRGRKKAG